VRESGRLLTALFLLFVAGCSKEGRTLEWQTVSCPDGRFSVLMPGLPERTTEPARGGHTFNKLKVIIGGSSYLVGYVIVPKGMNRNVNDFFTELFRPEEWRITSESAVHFEGGQGKEAEAVERKTGERVAVRVIQREMLHCMLIVQAKTAYLSDPNVQRFFGSFQVTK